MSTRAPIYELYSSGLGGMGLGGVHRPHFGSISDSFIIDEKLLGPEGSPECFAKPVV